ncbi:MAG: SgcJ/EcaC family oxidoreductase [Rhodothermales bacterium]|nr:SgcJ/EcaC family oxidoreductase [Rhodothermales bacterium]
MRAPRNLLALIVLALVAACTSGLSATDKEKLATARQMVDAWNVKDWDQVFDLFATDGVLQSMMSEPIIGREEIRSQLADLLSGIEQIELQIVNMGIVDDVVVLERVDDFVYKGKRSRVPVVGVMEIQDGKVTEWREYYDQASLLSALVAEDNTVASETEGAVAEIQDLVTKLQEDWNGGDMQAYLDAYWDDEGMALVFSDRVVLGKDAMTEMFTSTWPNEAKMGDFATEDVNVIVLNPDLAIAKGRFQHQFTDSLIVGAFSHILVRGDDGQWKIVHEHTSRKNSQ